VKEITSPEVLVLDNGLRIRLIGIREKTRGQKVFLKFDTVKYDRENEKYDKENELFCYLYLRNKTFINAHLIKNGLVDVDTVSDYKYKSKFLEYRGRSKNE